MIMEDKIKIEMDWLTKANLKHVVKYLKEYNINPQLYINKDWLNLDFNHDEVSIYVNKIVRDKTSLWPLPYMCLWFPISFSKTEKKEEESKESRFEDIFDVVDSRITNG